MGLFRKNKKFNIVKEIQELPNSEKLKVLEELEEVKNLRASIKKYIKEINKYLPKFQIGREFMELGLCRKWYKIYPTGEVTLYGKFIFSLVEDDIRNFDDSNAIIQMSVFTYALKLENGVR
jgi:hypothetical protein